MYNEAHTILCDFTNCLSHTTIATSSIPSWFDIIYRSVMLYDITWFNIHKNIPILRLDILFQLFLFLFASSAFIFDFYDRIIAGWLLNSQAEIQMQCPVVPETMAKLSHCLSVSYRKKRCLVGWPDCLVEMIRRRSVNATFWFHDDYRERLWTF